MAVEVLMIMIWLANRWRQESAKALVSEGGDAAIKRALTRVFEFYRGD